MMKTHDDMPRELNDLTGEIVDCFFHVHKELGAGYSEKLYEDACVFEFEQRSLSFIRQKSFKVFYKGSELPTVFQPDLIVENKVLLELKAVEKIHPVHQSQIYSYLKTTNLPIGFLVNFNVPLIKDGITRYLNRNSESPQLRVNNIGKGVR